MTLRFPALGLLAALLLSLNPASAGTDLSRTLLIGGDDGYGTSACLADGSSCGQIVADALCEARGFSKAEAFRKADPEEMTASIKDSTAAKDVFIISCGE